MTGPIKVRNATDTWVNQVKLDVNYSQRHKLHLQTLASNNKYAFMYFNKPWPTSGATITSAQLVLTQSGGPWSSGTTLTVERVSAKWNQDKINYRNQPAVTGTAATLTSGGATSDGNPWYIDVTSLCQSVASGANWFGFRIRTSLSTDTQVWSTQAPVGANRPMLIVSWVIPPDTPDNLKPAGGRYVSPGKQFLTWSYADADGDNTMQAAQVQFGASEAALNGGTSTWDSGSVPTSEPQLDLAPWANNLSDSGFESSIAGWSALFASNAWSTAQARQGTHSLANTATGAAGVSILSPTFPILPGQSAFGAGFFRAATTVRSWQARVHWLDATGAANGDGANGTATADTNTGWTQVSTPVSVAPANTAAYQIIFASTTTPAANEVHYLDDVTQVLSPALSPTINGDSPWWRCRNQDNTGAWSPWAPAVNYNVATDGVLTITAPTGSIQEGSPTVSWTFTGQTQRAYQVIVAKSTSPNVWLWDSGKITSSAQSMAIPFGVIVDAGASYIITVRVWDMLQRESIPNDPAWVEAKTAALAISYDAGTAAVTSLSFASDPVLPVGSLTFNSASAPDSFQIQRSDDGGTTWYFYDEKLPSDISTGGTSYSYKEVGAKRYVTHTYRALRVVAGKMSASNPVVNGSIQRVAPILMRQDGTDLCVFLAPERDRQRFGVQGVFTRMDGPPVLVTQRVGGQGGNVSGRFVDGTPTGYTAKQMRASFLAMEADSGQKMVIGIADETIIGYAYNFNIEPIVDTGGVTYQASFSWIDSQS